MSGRAQRGRAGEDFAAAFLRKKGFIISARNFHSRFGEIDIIAENDKYILFVEVKTRKNGSLVQPCEAVDAAKRKKIMITANTFLSRCTCELQPRFDVAEITVFGENEREEYKINYIENAFEPEDFYGLF